MTGLDVMRDVSERGKVKRVLRGEGNVLDFVFRDLMLNKRGLIRDDAIV